MAKSFKISRARRFQRKNLAAEHLREQRREAAATRGRRRAKRQAPRWFARTY